jgi:hypothetical protein
MWLAPAAMFIESAANGLKSVDSKMLEAEIQEISSFGTKRIQDVFEMIHSLVGDDLNQAFDQCDPAATDAITFTHGYLLGLQVARTILMGSPQLAIKGIKSDSLL